MISAITPVREALSGVIFGVLPTMRVSEALDFIREHGVTHLPVVVEGRAAGVVCTCDLEDARLDAFVSSVMHTPVVSVPHNASLGEAAVLMAERGVGSVIVTEEERPLGILTRTDFGRFGLAEAAFGERRCFVCKTYDHVRMDERCGYFLCGACRAGSRAPRDDQELGSGD
ncbi:MAG: CBS domain-containing protein [Polyangiaceae bacterium]